MEWKAEVRRIAQAEIRTCNLPIANPGLYHTAIAHIGVYVYIAYTVRHIGSKLLV